MIKIKVVENENNLKEIKITGHALYDDYGKDIVCASFSSILITTLNAIERLDKDSITYDKKVSLIKILKNDETTNILINNMIDLFKQLEHDYPKNIKFY